MSETTTTPLLVGVYAMLPTDPAEQAELYAGLRGSGADGLEIPDHHLRAEDGSLVEGLLDVLGLGFTSSVVTAIPSTMKRQAGNSGEGLASAREDLRRAALGVHEEIGAAIERVNDHLGRAAITGVLVHSAPTGAADVGAFRRSLEELEASAALGVPLTVNWGRSVVESHDPATPEQQIRGLAAAGLLGGVAFSGASRDTTPYGAPWADVHLPLDADEPASLLTARPSVRASTRRAAPNATGRSRCRPRPVPPSPSASRSSARSRACCGDARRATIRAPLPASTFDSDSEEGPSRRPLLVRRVPAGGGAAHSGSCPLLWRCPRSRADWWY